MGPLAGLTLGVGIGRLIRMRTAIRGGGTPEAAGEMAKVSPGKFLREVRSEVEKVTWPTRRETAITTAMVFVMVAVASVFFLIADQIIRVLITFVLGLGS